MDEQKDPFPALGDTEVDGSENLGLNHRVAGTEEQFAQLVELFGVLGLQKRGNLLHQHVAHAKIDSVLDKAVPELVSGVIRVSAPHSAAALARMPSDLGVWRAAAVNRAYVLSGRQSVSDGFRLFLHPVA